MIADAERFLSRVEGPELALRTFRGAWARRRLAHAYLFAGPAGSGRRAFASALARALLCRTGEPCETCPSCRAVEHGNHPDLEVFSSRSRRSVMDIDDVRAVARRDHRRHHTSLRVWIIEDCERLSIPSSNALLKTLEEPGAGTILLLIAPSTGSLLPTIVSRCQRILFPGRADDPGDAGGTEVAVERLREALEPRFLVDHDPREWLSSLVPDAANAREALAAVLERAIETERREWKESERGASHAGAGGEQLRLLEDLLVLRADLDGNVNVDLVLDALLRALRLGARRAI